MRPVPDKTPESEFRAALEGTRAIAIVRGNFTVGQYLEIAAALVDSGLVTIEFTIEQPSALTAIREIRQKQVDGLWLGAGTVRTADAAERALDAGARYLVSPGFVPGVAQVAREQGAVYLPGVLTPTEMERAKAADCNVVKLFPAKPMGPEYLQALTAPMYGMAFVPTGGIGMSNAREFLAAGALAVGIGGGLIDKSEPLEKLRERTVRLMSILRGVERSG